MTTTKSEARVSRRDLLKSTAATAALAASGRMGDAFAAEGAAAKAAAQPRIPYGAAVHYQLIETDRAYRMALQRYCQQIVPEGALKWDALRPKRDTFDFGEGDKLAAFAKANKMSMRGHTLVWYAALPEWTKDISNALEAERELVKHIETVVSHYKGFIKSWDVVNEAIADNPRHSRDYRDCIWLKHLGPRYLEIALRTAAAVDPDLQLVVNDMNLAINERPSRKKREALLTLARDIKDKGAPLHAIGFQGHLPGEVPIDTDGVSRLASALKAEGMAILVTELDVIDGKLPAEIAERDVIVAKRAGDFLQAIDAGAPVTSVLTWGITDRYTWVPMYHKRADGYRNRPLPLDFVYAEKPFMHMLQKFCGGPRA